jgi:hypothetical protein
MKFFNWPSTESFGKERKKAACDGKNLNLIYILAFKNLFWREFNQTGSVSLEYKFWRESTLCIFQTKPPKFGQLSPGPNQTC